MENVARAASSCKLEDRYALSKDDGERRQLRAEILATYRPRLRSLVRALLPKSPQHWDEAEQTAIVGLFEALNAHEPGPSAASFWTFAYRFVRDELRTWLGVGVFWNKPANRGTSAVRRAAAAAERRPLAPVSLDAPLVREADENSLESLHDVLASDVPTPEEAVIMAEGLRAAADFLDGLSLRDRTYIEAILTTGGRPGRRYRDLLQTAREAFK